MQAIPVYIISLARAADRRTAISRHLESLGIEFVMTDAVDGHAIPPHERQQLVAPPLEYHPGVLGCYLSHTNVYRRMMTTDAPVSLILEDDALLNPAFVPAILNGVRSMDFDYCFLDCEGANEDGPVYYDLNSGVTLFPGFTMYRTHAGPATTHAYLITKEAAAKRLAHELPIRKPIDVYSTLPYQPRFYALVQPKGAWVSEASLRSFTSARDHSSRPPRFRALRSSEAFYRVRDLLSVELLKRRWRVRHLVAAGVLRGEGRWRPLPSGRPVVYGR